jgi:hypothetical protein
VTIFGYSFDIKFNLIALECLNSFAFTVVMIGLSMRAVYVNLI